MHKNIDIFGYEFQKKISCDKCGCGEVDASMRVLATDPINKIDLDLINEQYKISKKDRIDVLKLPLSRSYTFVKTLEINQY